MGADQKLPARTRRLRGWLRWLWLVGLVGGCSLHPSFSLNPPAERASGSSSSARGESGRSLAPTATPLSEGKNGKSPSATPRRTTKAAQTLTPTPTPFFAAQGEICQQAICILEVTFPFQRPIRPPGTDTVDPTYRYGSTQNGHREVHHGVEFINKAGVAIYAVADGVVEFAGEDDQLALATKKGFYGKVIVLKHALPGFSLPIYTVYGHVLSLLVQPGERVTEGQQIGEVGLGGVAAGTHLHFEVRYGKNEYDATRNPELWLTPAYANNSGVLLGRFLDPQGTCLAMENVVLEPLGTADALLKRRYFSTYEEAQMRCLPPWLESFGINDLPAGRYRLSFIYSKPESVEFEIVPGKATYLNLHLP